MTGKFGKAGIAAVTAVAASFFGGVALADNAGGTGQTSGSNSHEKTSGSNSQSGQGEQRGNGGSATKNCINLGVALVSGEGAGSGGSDIGGQDAAVAASCDASANGGDSNGN